MHLTADIHTRTRARHFFFFAWASALLHTFWTGRGLLVCLILYLGWEHVFGGMVLLINILYTLYCTRTSTRCESTRWVEELSECFLPLCRFFFFFQFLQKVLSSVHTFWLRSQPSYGDIVSNYKSVQREARDQFVHCFNKP